MQQKPWWLALAVALGIAGCVVTGCEPEAFTLNDATEIQEAWPDAQAAELHVCIDRSLPFDKHSPEKAAVLPRKLWKVGQTLRVRFLGGDTLVQRKVMQHAKAWEQFANIKLQEVTGGQAEIRIAFKDEGSWSYIGRDALYLPQDSATMNFGWFTRKTSDREFSRTTLHEFGHALGMIHEHQNPAAGIPWDTAAVYAYYTAAPNNWTREDVQHNLLERYNASYTQFCLYDPLSIMHYPIPEAHTLGNFHVGLNTHLSAEDQRFVSKLYPFIGVRGTLNCDDPPVQRQATAASKQPTRYLPNKQ